MPPPPPFPRKCGPSDEWSVYPGHRSTSLALPDYFSTYLSYSYDTLKYPNKGLRISGQFPSARYLSFNVYATRTGTSLNALTDFQIQTKDPAGNPFVAGNPDAGGDYIIHVQPQADDPPDLENLLTYNPADLKEGLLTVVLRYYVPQVNDDGGVDCPRVMSYGVNKPYAPPSPTPPEPYPAHMDLNEPFFRQRLAPIFQTTAENCDPLRFYHAAGGGQFNNADNMYLIAAVKQVDPAAYCVVVRVRPPDYPAASDQFDQRDVRYWSFNQGNPTTSTPYGMRDSQFRPAKGGSVYILMGDDSLAGHAEARGYNFMRWAADSEQAVIIYRNMLTVPQYRHSMARVPKLPKPRPDGTWAPETLTSYEAANYLGAYAPAGRRVSNQDFIINSGGMPSPGFA